MIENRKQWTIVVGYRDYGNCIGQNTGVRFK